MSNIIQIKEVFGKINSELSKTTNVNDESFRDFIKDKAEKELPDCIIVCDESTNPPQLINNDRYGVIVTWVENNVKRSANIESFF